MSLNHQSSLLLHTAFQFSCLLLFIGFKSAMERNGFQWIFELDGWSITTLADGKEEGKDILN